VNKLKVLKTRYVVRIKMCKTGGFLSFVVFILALTTSVIPAFYPVFIFSLTDFIITILPAIYVEKYQEE
jgi:hypothetical protein